MKRLLNTTYGWILFLVLIIAVNLLASICHYRIDLTAEKRFTLSKVTKQLLHDINDPEVARKHLISEPGLTMIHNPNDPVKITVFLAGEMPAGFKKLANSTQELLEEFKEQAPSTIQYRFTKPGEGMDENTENAFLDSLHRLGLNPTNVKAQTKEGEGQEERLVYPGALVQYKDRVTAIDLLQGQSSVDGINSLNNAEALLEYKFANTIHKLTIDTVPLIGYLSGNGEPLSYNVYSLIEGTLRPNYVFRILPIDSVATIPSIFSALMIVKPTVPFTDEQKLKLDQYIMHGGKVMWMMDRLYAEMDSLQRTQNEFIAFDRNLNLDDILFKYGVRINPDLVEDLNCDVYPAVIGSEGGKPQMQLLPFNYFPLLSNYSGHPIAKNLDYIVSQFPQSIDTVQTEGIKKTILLATSPESRILSTPARVSFQELQTEANKSLFNQSSVPIAVLLEGKFASLYTNRLFPAVKDSIGFLPANISDNKMIIVSDGDIALNTVSQKEGPLSMGMNMFTKYQYANREFVLNCLEYLTDNSGILETRSKDYTLRLLDKKKIEEQKLTWQLINILAPLLLVILFGFIYQAVRKKKYT